MSRRCTRIIDIVGDTVLEPGTEYCVIIYWCPAHESVRQRRNRKICKDWGCDADAGKKLKTPLLGNHIDISMLAQKMEKFP
jgi:hypothetical protein